MTEAMVRIEDAHKRFGKLEVLRGVTTNIARGEVVVLLGASGSGKTTLLRCINHLETLDGGRIYVDDEMVGYREAKGKLVEDKHSAIAKKRAQIGMVFQRFNLFPYLPFVWADFSEVLEFSGDSLADDACHSEVFRSRLIQGGRGFPRFILRSIVAEDNFL